MKPHICSVSPFRLLVIVLLVCGSVALGQDLSSGHQTLVQRGLQIQALTFPGEAGYSFDPARWADSNFTAVHIHGDTYNPGAMPSDPPGIPWSRTGYEATPEEYLWWSSQYYDVSPYLPNMISAQVADEEDITNSAILDKAKAFVDYFAVHYPQVIVHTNQYGWQSSVSQLRNYMNYAKPGMLMFDTYPFNGSLAGGSPTSFYSHMEKYRKLGLEGNDGTGAQPIPTGLYTQTFRFPGGHKVTESEIRLNNFSAWAFGYKRVTSFFYENVVRYTDILPVLFSDDGSTDNPTAQFYQVAETNRQSLNLGPALVRLISTDVRMKMGLHVGGNNTLPSGVLSWDSSADPYITSIAVTNLGSKNDDYEGDVIVGYFKPLHESFTNAGHEDDIYFMIVNGLSDATGSAADCEQLIQIQFDFFGTEIDSLLRLSRETGLVEQVSLVNLTGSVYGLDLYLDGGTGDLFKFNNGGLFVGEFLESLLGDANLDGVVSADDFACVQANYGHTGSPGGSLLGDANHDGWVGADDYASIQANFGHASGGMSAVPEPATVGLLLFGSSFLVLSRRSRRPVELV